MLPVEIHQLTRFHRLKSAAFPVAVVVALAAVYVGVQLYTDNVNLRAEAQAMKSRGCPSRLQGKPFAGNDYKEVDLMRPRYSTLTCLYRSGVKS